MKLSPIFFIAVIFCSCTNAELNKCDYYSTACVFKNKPCDGKCEKGMICDENSNKLIPCVPNCVGKECGGNGCGDFCGICKDNEICNEGKCEHICVPQCTGKECGSDGCGAECGKCVNGLQCSETFHCVSKKDGCFAKEEPGCNGCACEKCVCDKDEFCCKELWRSSCVQSCAAKCSGECGCVPQCDLEKTQGIPFIKECGDDGCGGSCGKCPPGKYCNSYGACIDSPGDLGRPCMKNNDCVYEQCVPAEDGSRVCSRTCINKCPSGFECKKDIKGIGFCFPLKPCCPDCADKECGSNGCGGVCGECEKGFECSKFNKCVPVSDGCKPTPFVPSCGGCKCQNCVCEKDPLCCLLSWDAHCVILCDNCENPCFCPECLNASTGCSTSLKPACNQCSCESCVCEKYPYCCAIQWDSLCVLTCIECGMDCLEI